MQKKMMLSIPEPCHENWNQMNPTDHGKFCLSCQKEVIDFSEMTDKELYNYFLQQKNKDVCGRMLSAQLNNSITRPIEARKKKFWYVHYLTTLFLFINKSETKAQTKAPVTVSPVDKSPLLVGKMVSMPQESGVRTTEGKITDATGDAIPFAAVKIKGAPVGLVADGNGRFAIKTRNSQILQISAVGFLAKEIEIAGQSFLDIKLEYMVVGEVSFRKPNEKKKKNQRKKSSPVININTSRTAESIPISPKLTNLSEIAPAKTLSDIKLLKETTAQASYTIRMGAVSTGMVIVKQRSAISSFKKVIDTISGKNIIKTYPNPVTKGSLFNVDMKNVSNGEYSLQLNSETGSVVQQERITVPGKNFIYQMQVRSTIAAGIYFLNIISPENRIIHKQKIIIL